MSRASKVLTIGLDGLWMPMEFARLLHLIVRFYRLEQLIEMSRAGGPNLLDDRLNAIVLKYLAAFDWIAAPLMSRKFNESYERSEDFVRDFGLTDLRVLRVAYDAVEASDIDPDHTPGEIAFAGSGPVIERMYAMLEGILGLKDGRPFIGDDSQGRIADIEVLYSRNLKEKANLMRHMGYSDAELNAIVSPSIEDLHFLSNAIAQGRIVAVEKSAAPG